MFNNFEFVNPGFFWLLALLPLALLWYIFKRKKQTAELKISSLQGFKATPSFLPKLKPLLFVLRLLLMCLPVCSQEILNQTVWKL